MPDKYYITPNGTRVSQSQIYSRYGQQKGDSLISSGTFKEASQSSTLELYQTPNGQTVSKDDIKNKYGNRADELINNGTFKSVKKKKNQHIQILAHLHQINKNPIHQIKDIHTQKILRHYLTQQLLIKLVA